jgi:hypothetical protein
MTRRNQRFIKILLKLTYLLIQYIFILKSNYIQRQLYNHYQSYINISENNLLEKLFNGQYIPIISIIITEYMNYKIRNLN